MPVLGGALLAAWLGVQPWVSWPGLFADTSHRLTLFLLSIALVFSRLGVSNSARLPGAWVGWAVACLSVLGYGLRDAFRTGEYFTFFVETAVVSNGIACVVALTLGLWAMIQQPVTVLRQMRWVGFAFLSVNIICALGQRLASIEHAAGVLGIDRGLASYAVAWVPFGWAWHPLIGWMACVGLLLAGKPLALVAALLALWPVVKQKWWLVLGVAAAQAILLPQVYAVTSKASQRLDTWWHGLQASLAHPFVGWGFSPMVIGKIQHEYGYALPSLHNDWLLLAVGAGWGVTVWALWLWGRAVFAAPVNQWAAACQGSLLGLGCLSFVQSTVSHPRIASLALFLLAWWLVEQRTERVSHA